LSKIGKEKRIAGKKYVKKSKIGSALNCIQIMNLNSSYSMIYTGNMWCYTVEHYKCHQKKLWHDHKQWHMFLCQNYLTSCVFVTLTWFSSTHWKNLQQFSVISTIWNGWWFNTGWTLASIWNSINLHSYWFYHTLK